MGCTSSFSSKFKKQSAETQIIRICIKIKASVQLIFNESNDVIKNRASMLREEERITENFREIIRVAKYNKFSATDEVRDSLHTSVNLLKAVLPELAAKLTFSISKATVLLEDKENKSRRPASQKSSSSLPLTMPPSFARSSPPLTPSTKDKKFVKLDNGVRRYSLECPRTIALTEPTPSSTVGKGTRTGTSYFASFSSDYSRRGSSKLRSLDESDTRGIDEEDEDSFGFFDDDIYD